MRVCTICTHQRRPEIDRALLAGEPLRNIAQRYGTSPAALHRHKGHVAGVLRAQQALTVERLLSDLADLQQRALRLLAKAEGSGDLRAALAATREARETVMAIAKIIETSELESRITKLEEIIEQRRAHEQGKD